MTEYYHEWNQQSNAISALSSISTFCFIFSCLFANTSVPSSGQNGEINDSGSGFDYIALLVSLLVLYSLAYLIAIFWIVCKKKPAIQKQENSYEERRAQWRNGSRNQNETSPIYENIQTIENPIYENVQ